MKQKFVLGIVMLALVWVMVWFYERLPQLQGWVIFSALAGVAMSRRPCPDKPAKGAR